MAVKSVSLDTAPLQLRVISECSLTSSQVVSAVRNLLASSKLSTEIQHQLGEFKRSLNWARKLALNERSVLSGDVVDTEAHNNIEIPSKKRKSEDSNVKRKRKKSENLESQSSEEEESKKFISMTLINYHAFYAVRLLLSVFLWFFFTTFSNIEAKRYLLAGGSPLVLSLISLAFCPLALLIVQISYFIARLTHVVSDGDGFNIVEDVESVKEMSAYPKPKPTYRDFLISILPVTILHVGNTLFTNASMQNVDIKLTYTIKSAEPLTTAVLMFLMLGKTIPLRLFLSLMPIPIGVLLATIGDVSFNVSGILTALLSTVIASARSVVFKNHSDNYKTMPNTFADIQRFLHLGTLGFILLFPLYLIKYHIIHQFTNTQEEIIASFTELVNHHTRELLVRAGAFHFLYNLFSFDVLSQVSSPVTHSLFNVGKRVVTILYSMFYFKNRLVPINMIGIMLANLGVFWYVREKSRCQKDCKTCEEKTISEKEAFADGRKEPQPRIAQTLIVIIALLLIVTYGIGDKGKEFGSQPK
ncbi:hypothetical protein HK096_005175 [Nowakowskiella sp. JEL0078]|nr:hypothetical protein HK096_005175 [Nowakowskiella sp. JEL0078]